MKSIIGIVAVAGAAAAASALPANIDRSGYTIYAPASAQALDVSSPEFAGVAYSNLTNSVEGFFSIANTAPVANGALDVVSSTDYQSIAPNGGFLEQFRFVGGVNAAQTDPFLPPNPGGVVFFDFFDAGGNFVDGFGVNLSQAGNFIWTINISSEVAVAAGGFVQMAFDDENLFGAGAATRAQWFVTADAATVGNNLNAEFTSPLGNGLHHAFEMTLIPAPGAVAIMGLGGLMAARRRR